ncbi:MAG: MaoC family dehydratase [Deltaproteobacteria bacterium]|nr:MaoC family dehydratase [Deltaproteobacteria bacterium]
MSERKIPITKQKELAKTVPINLPEGIKKPEYGRTLEEFVEGQVFTHPRGFTISDSFAQEFATTFLDTNPLYLNAEYAKGHGFRGQVVPPLMVLNLALSMGVQNDSEKAVAHLGYYDVVFPRTVYPGDTLRSMTKVLARQDRGEGKPGIVTVRTVGLNQKDEIVVQYDRKIMIPTGKEKKLAESKPGILPEIGAATAWIPRATSPYPKLLTGPNTYFEDFTVGDIIVHANGRTISEEHYAWTYRLGNTHPLHYDKIYTQSRSGPLSGQPVVYGGLVFAWLAGLASRDTTENGLWDFGYTEGYHTQPVIAGDTVYAISRVLHKEPHPDPIDEKIPAGMVTFQLIGVKNRKGSEALEKYGADLFVKENDKKALGKEKIPEKIFEIERRVLIKKRP